ncbi:hypothetical protein JDV09_15385 [Mycobacterium sp. Y57]|uniref:DUF7341 domain-containing protein n=1 Tax=Mycolicibacterium xanthum TaxID=2796469 RepID=UPI001C853AAC|nr:hypothetical protein [Mycolicibacterium xanthum]MBX7433483.1 hypothetical protein [Mycolicibacterium xanthum]
MIANPDGALAPALRRLSDGVRALADPVPEWSHGTLRWSDPVYDRLRARLAGGALSRSGSASKSRPPCNVAALDWLAEVDGVVAGWTRDGKGTTAARLRALVDYGWRPMDVEQIDGYSDRIERWVLTAVELLGDAPIIVPLRMPCPSCGCRFAYRRADDGGHLRVDALSVGEFGAGCAACRAKWPPAEFHWLARLLGVPALPA